MERYHGNISIRYVPTLSTISFLYPTMASPTNAVRHAMKDMKFSFLGLGQMASHFLEPLLEDGIIHPENVIGTQYSEETVKAAREKFPGIHVTMDNHLAATEGDVVFLGVKPTDLPAVSSVVNGGMKKDSLLISMLAAVPMRRISEAMENPRVCRCMPNTPVKIRQGVIPYVSTPEVSSEQREMVDNLFSALGYPMELTKESHLDISTAISGSSPAYFFLIMEAMADAGVHCGLPRRQAELMAMKSMQGSVNFALAQHGRANFAELKAAVTSPGGTTASALHQAEKNGLRATVAEIVWACYRRSLEIASNDFKVYGPGTWEPKIVS